MVTVKIPYSEIQSWREPILPILHALRVGGIDFSKPVTRYYDDYEQQYVFTQSKEK